MLDIMDKKERMIDLAGIIKSCQKCALSKTRINAVVGEGSFDSKILFIGEAPGSNEDRQGRPFVGRAGKILDELLESINLKRDQVYIANILKCRPPQNRNPNKNEIEMCTDYLDLQVDLINPLIIVPLGNFSYQYIFEKYGLPIDKISKVHGKTFKKQTLQGVLYIVPMYHPAVATYNPNKKDELLHDFKSLQDILNTISMRTMSR
jgi:uracil-DNA glycosylase